jgi:hypothetical protein
MEYLLEYVTLDTVIMAPSAHGGDDTEVLR